LREADAVEADEEGRSQRMAVRTLLVMLNHEVDARSTSRGVVG
jgi:hypothetical protein